MRALAEVGGAGLTAVPQSAHVATSPRHAGRLAGALGRDAATTLRLLLTPVDAATAINGDPGVSRRVAWSSPLSLEKIKHTANAHDATVNDVLLAAISGALRHYLKDQHSPVAEIQAMVPFNLRPLDRPVPRELGNKVGLVFLPLPSSRSTRSPNSRPDAGPGGHPGGGPSRRSRRRPHVGSSRMRRWMVLAGVALGALGLAGVALAAFRQVALVALTHGAGKSTGINADVHSSDPTAPGQKPKSRQRR